MMTSEQIRELAAQLYANELHARGSIIQPMSMNIDLAGWAFAAAEAFAKVADVRSAEAVRERHAIHAKERAAKITSKHESPTP